MAKHDGPNSRCDNAKHNSLKTLDDPLSRLCDVFAAGRNGRIRAGLSSCAQRRADARERIPQDRRRGSACLFESVVGGEKVGRYSFLAAEPFMLLEAFDRDVTLSTRQRRVEEHVQQTIRSLNFAHVCKEFASPSCLSCRRLWAGPLVTRATTRFATSKNCRTHRRRSRSARSVVRVLRPHARLRQRAEDGDRGRAGEASADGEDAGASTSSAQLTTTLAGGSIAWSKSSRRHRRFAAPVDIETGGDPHLKYQSNFTQPSLKTRSASVSSTSARATSFRS